MRLPRIDGVVERRLLVNYRVDPDVVARVLPAPFRPQLVDGAAVAGICLLRMGALRPAWLPAAVGLRSENAAHRIAVEWEDAGETRTGVYIPRRDSSSIVNVLGGGRFFPGEHHAADFTVEESPTRLHVGFTAKDGTASVDVEAELAGELQGSRLFADLAGASAFFEQGAAGFSATRDAERYDGLHLATRAWKLEACRVLSAASSFFDDTSRFPPGSAVLDSALVMRQVPVSWTSLPSLTRQGTVVGA